MTRKCPVCDEEIPVRLLDRHAQLEAERVDDIIQAIGSTEALDIAEPDDGYVTILFTVKKEARGTFAALQLASVSLP